MQNVLPQLLYFAGGDYLEITGCMSGKEWENWATQLLLKHYGADEYQIVPDQQQGDAGIEGFTRTQGYAYQMYGPEGSLTTSLRYKKLRTKMTNDIKKFCTNQDLLAEIFGSVTIHRWFLFTPFFDSKDILKHASKKTEEVLSHNLPYVSDDFQIGVLSRDNFRTEEDQLFSSNTRLSLSEEFFDDSLLNDWENTNQELNKTLERKITSLACFVSLDKQRFKKEILRSYIQGQVAVEELQQYPTLYAQYYSLKTAYESHLYSQAIFSSNPTKYLKECLDGFECKLKEDLRSISSNAVTTLAWEAISDWLISCPLDFPGEVDS